MSQQLPDWQAIVADIAQKNEAQIKQMRAAMSDATLEDAQIINYRYVPAPKNASPYDQYVITNVTGNSLQAARIWDGDWIMWKRTGDACHGDLVVVETPYGTTVKFFHFDGATVMLLNKPDSKGIEFHPSEITIRGIVVTSGRDWTKGDV